MAEHIIIDTGPLVALLNRTDTHHQWAIEQFGRLEPPFLTCEAVLSETQFLLREHRGNPLAVMEMVQRGALHIPLAIETEVERILELQHSYRALPMSLADACLVRITEKHERSLVFTTDTHFRIYRRHGKQPIPVLLPM